MEYIEVDSRGRCSLGRLARGHDRFRLIPGDDGSLLLVPVVQLDAFEQVLERRPEFRAAIVGALREVEQGEARRMGTFDEEMVRLGLDPDS